MNCWLVAWAVNGEGQEPETMRALENGAAPNSFEKLWESFDPRAEPLEAEILHEWEQDDVIMRVVRFRIGVFKGKKAKLAAVYGFPKNRKREQRLPGLLQIHGGGQYADYRACVANAKRGYATISISWAGRITAPGYNIGPEGVKLFWDEAKTNKKVRSTTDWGALDAYHAPSRFSGSPFTDLSPASWTLDSVESPRNSGWFLCALAARRALTFLEKQEEINPNALGVYGHSMGGKLTVMTASDSRVKAAAPSCGGISDRVHRSKLYQQTITDNVSLRQISCPIFFLCPANDFHGRIGDLPLALNEIKSRDWRVNCSPHHNHQDTAEYEVATLLWFDQHLKHSFQTPKTPRAKLKVDKKSGSAFLKVAPDSSMKISAVDVYYTYQGEPNEQSSDLQKVIHRFWHHSSCTKNEDGWTAPIEVVRLDRPIWVYANVQYQLDEPVTGAGYYYREYTANTFQLSSNLIQLSSSELRGLGAKQRNASRQKLIEDFEGAWSKEWFSYRPNGWPRTTHKINSPIWKAPHGAQLSMEVRSAMRNKLVVTLDQYVAELQLEGGNQWQKLVIRASQFRDFNGKPLESFSDTKRLSLGHVETLRPNRGTAGKPKQFGGIWRGIAPEFRELRWDESYSFLDRTRQKQAQSDYRWTRDHIQVGVRWQPFIGRPKANEFDARRPVISESSSYVQFWASWPAIEPQRENIDYEKKPSPGLQALEQAVDECRRMGLKVEFVLMHCPAWASTSGKPGGFRPKDGLFESHVARLAKHFKGRVDAYQLAHEANLEGMMRGADAKFVIDEILATGAKTVREIYQAKPARSVLVSTTGMSPCQGCPTIEGLVGGGAKAVSHFYDLMIANQSLMRNVDALNLNVSDHGNGFGSMDGKVIDSVWGQFDLLRRKLDKAGQQKKAIMASESWIVWDDANSARDINGDGKKDEQDAVFKTVAIYGKCLERGLNTINLPWSDNSSAWAMGLTKRRDYNGRIQQIRPDLVVSAEDGGPGIVTRKLALRGSDTNFTIHDGSGKVFSKTSYSNASDPWHVHAYFWRWYAQIACGSHEAIRHAIAGEKGNDIRVMGPAFSGRQRYRICSWDRTRRVFTVLVFAGGATGNSPATIEIPARIQSGKYYNNDSSPIDFRGEGAEDGAQYYARVITKDISWQNGKDIKPVYFETEKARVIDGKLEVVVPNMNRFTAVEFVPLNQSKK